MSSAPAEARHLFASRIVAIDDPEFAADPTVSTADLCAHPKAENAVAVLDACWEELVAIATKPSS